MQVELDAPQSVVALKLYLASIHWLNRIVKLLSAGLTGFWLGVLSRETLQSIDQAYYNGQRMYVDENYNRSGLQSWEQRILDAYFLNARSLFLVGAGGGREVLALRQAGYEVDSCECHPILTEFANALLEKEGFVPDVKLVPRNDFWRSTKVYDGLIVGWGTYMLIQGRDRRIQFLKALHTQMKPGSPLLISFFCHANPTRYFKAVARIGNFFRWVLRREYLDVGDTLEPEFVHYFTRDQIVAELESAGFEMVMYGTNDYGHAVGVAR